MMRIVNIILISNADELQAVNSNLDADYKLVSNIDLSGVVFTPLGDVSDEFDGTFDGGGFTISNLTIDLSASNDLGLFGSNTGVIKDFTLENVDITGNDNIGGLVGTNDGTIDNITSFGMVVGNTHIGGFIGSDTGGSYTDNKWCYFANVDLDAVGFGGDSDGNIEGIDVYICISTATELQDINDSYSNLSKSYILINDIDLSVINDFNPIANYNSFTGTFEGNGFTLSNLNINRSWEDGIGLFGASGGTIRNLILDNANIRGKDLVGGLVGLNNEGTISNVSFSGDVTGNGDRVGGFVGFDLRGIIEDSIYSGNVEGNNFVGGFVGYETIGTISNNSFSGSVDGNNNVGGFAGFNSSGTMEDNISSGSVTGSSEVGGFIGLSYGGSYTNNEWCKPIGSSLTDTGSGGLGGVVALDENCQ